MIHRSASSLHQGLLRLCWYLWWSWLPTPKVSCVRYPMAEWVRATINASYHLHDYLYYENEETFHHDSFELFESDKGFLHLDGRSVRVSPFCTPAVFFVACQLNGVQRTIESIICMYINVEACRHWENDRGRQTDCKRVGAWVMGLDDRHLVFWWFSCGLWLLYMVHDRPSTESTAMPNPTLLIMAMYIKVCKI